MRWTTVFRVTSVLGAAILASVSGEMGVRAQAVDGRTARVEAALEAAEAELIAIRRDIHRHPELSGRERRTAALVAERLRSLGMEVRTGIGGHGVVGIMRGGLPGSVVAFRADMDAVPDGSPDPVEFRSVVPGVRHVCGHDVHTTVGLAIAEALTAVRSDMRGTVVFIFQPAEENIQGAVAMIAEGVLADPAPEAIFAFHTAPLEVGQIGYVEGLGLPGFDIVDVRVLAGADPAALARRVADLIAGTSTVGPPTDPGSVGEDFIWAISSRRRDPGGEGYVVRGRIKASGDDQYAAAKRRIMLGLADLEREGMRYEADYRDRVLPDMVNDPALVRASLEPMAAAIGSDNVIDSGPTPYFGEDFAFFQREIPGVMYWLGVSNSEKGTVGMPHSPGYVADEGAILVGARAMSAVLLSFLDGGS